MLNPFCPRQELLHWIVQKSNTSLSLLSEDVVRAHLSPYFGSPLHCGEWEQLEEAELSEDQKTVVWPVRSGCGTAKIPWSSPIWLDDSCWRFAVKMKPLGVLCVDHLLEYDAAAAVLRRRSANGGWGTPSDLQPPVSRKGRRASSVVMLDVDTATWSFRIGLEQWLSHWVPLHFPKERLGSCLRLSVVLLRNGAQCTFLDVLSKGRKIKVLGGVKTHHDTFTFPHFTMSDHVHASFNGTSMFLCSSFMHAHVLVVPWSWFPFCCDTCELHCFCGGPDQLIGGQT